MPHPIRVIAIRVLAAVIAVSGPALAQERTIPARTIPTPTTVSPELQRIIAAPWDGSEGPMTLTDADWKTLRKRGDDAQAQALQTTKQQLGVSVTAEKIAGVQAYRVKPAAIAPENRNRILVHVHGGAYVFGGGEAAAGEAVLMAHFGKIEIVSVDYRMPPDFPYPAALDDALAVWKDVAKSRNPGNIGLFGTSTGGGMTLALVLKLKELKLPLPGAIMAGTPWAISPNRRYVLHQRVRRQRSRQQRRHARSCRQVVCRHAQLEGTSAFAGVWQLQWFPSGYPAIRHARPVPEQYRTGSSEALAGWRHRRTTRFRGPVARAIHAGTAGPRDQGCLDRGQPIFQSTFETITAAGAADSSAVPCCLASRDEDGLPAQDVQDAAFV